MARALHGKLWNVSAFVRAPVFPKARALALDGIETAAGDLGNRASERALMVGAYHVFSVQPSSGQGAASGVSDTDEIRFGTDIAEAALKAGIEHLVYSSANAVGPTLSWIGHFDTVSIVEDHIRGLTIPSTIVSQSAFLEILLVLGLGLDQGRHTFLMRPEQAMHFVAVADIGKVVARIFSDHKAF